ncbi:MAG: phasin family protein [Spirochaetes bacterium]|nr:phasin family protein [Spirochaetota bacterium]
MMESLKKALFAGIGLAAMSKEKIEEWAKNFAQEAKMAEEEGRKFIDEVLKHAEEAKRNVESQVITFTKNSLEKMGFTTRSEYEELKKRVEELERKIKEKNGQ